MIKRNVNQINCAHQCLLVRFCRKSTADWVHGCSWCSPKGVDLHDAKIDAAYTLTNITQQKQYLAAMAAAGAIQACVTVLQTGPDVAKIHATGTLGNISYMYFKQHVDYMWMQWWQQAGCNPGFCCGTTSWA
jgi:hypothetical protein